MASPSGYVKNLTKGEGVDQRRRIWFMVAYVVRSHGTKDSTDNRQCGDADVRADSWLLREDYPSLDLLAEM